jgi:hypothetical protein
MIPRKVEQAAWDDHHTLLVEHSSTKLLDRSGSQPFWESHRAGLWLKPGEPVSMLRKKSFSDGSVLPDDLDTASQDALFVLQGDHTQYFARRAVADGRIVFERQPALDQGALE